MLHPASPEQRHILGLIEAGNHVVCNAVAGAGKTTTVLHIAERFPGPILQLTYNRALALDTQNRAAALGLDNLTVTTFHAFATRHFDNNQSYTDEGMLRITEWTALRQHIPAFTIVVFDEAQDMKATIYGMLRIVLRHLPAAQLLVMGDTAQGVYAFAGTDTRFLTLAPQLFPRRHGSWCRAELTTTYRITHQMASFVNNYLCGDERTLVAAKSGPAVEYIVGNAYSIAKVLGTRIAREILAGSSLPSDIFVLAKSVRGRKSPVQILENILVRNRIPCYAPASDDSRVTEAILANKVVFSSFHQSKGRERPTVICFNFDSVHYSDAAACPAELYVAATRGSHRLILVQGGAPLPFLRAIPRTGPDLQAVTIGRPEAAPWQPKPRRAVTKLLRFIRPETIVELRLDQYFRQLRAPSRAPPAAATTEEVEDITGIAIPMLSEYRITGDCPIGAAIAAAREQALWPGRFEQPGLVLEIAACAPAAPTSIEAALRIANAFSALSSGLYHRAYQLREFNWIGPEAAEACLATLNSELQDRAGIQYEVPLSHTFGPLTLDGRADLVTDSTLYELKCTASLSSEHKLQLLTYAAMAEPRRSRNYRLLNMLTGEMYEYTYNHAHATQTIERLIEEANNNPAPTDSEFLAAARLYPPDPRHNDFIMERLTDREVERAALAAGFSPELLGNRENMEELLREYAEQ